MIKFFHLLILLVIQSLYHSSIACQVSSSDYSATSSFSTLAEFSSGFNQFLLKVNFSVSTLGNVEVKVERFRNNVFLEQLMLFPLTASCRLVPDLIDEVYPQNSKIVISIRCVGTSTCSFKREFGASTVNDDNTLGITVSPTNAPTAFPTKSPTLSPTRAPTLEPTLAPTRNPTLSPTFAPTKSPTTASPTYSPTLAPTRNPTLSPTFAPTRSPTTASPTNSPTLAPTRSPTNSPTGAPTLYGISVPYANCLNYQGNLSTFNMSFCDAAPRRLVPDRFIGHVYKPSQVCQRHRNSSTSFESLYPQPYEGSWPTLMSLQNVIITWPQLRNTNFNGTMYVSCGEEQDLEGEKFLELSAAQFGYTQDCVDVYYDRYLDPTSQRVYKICYVNFTVPEVFRTQNCTFLWKVNGTNEWDTCFDAQVIPIGIIGGENAGLLPILLTGLLAFGFLGFCARKKRKSNILIPERGNIEATAPLSKPTWTVVKKSAMEETPIQFEDAGKIEANYIKPVAPASTVGGHFGRVREPVKITHYGKEAPIILNMK